MTPPDDLMSRRHASSCLAIDMTPRRTSAQTAIGRFRAAGTIAIVAIVAACTTVPAPQQDVSQETARYVAHAKRNYVPPGPAEDPWGPYIREASAKFDVPEIWIRSLMRVESGGNEYLDGQLITSGAGAMGLMQVMPGTFDELRERYNLGDDPFDPHDNILAGVAYMREMYDLYGAPAFLAAYNAGPARLDDYLANTRPLPDETRRYVAMIGPNLRGVSPISRSAADELASNTFPINIPPGRRFSRPIMLAGAKPVGGGRVPARAPVEVAQLPDSRRSAGAIAAQQLAMITPPAAPSEFPPVPPPVPAHRGLHLITFANAADAAPVRRGGASAAGQWAIQIGAFAKPGQARSAVLTAQSRARVELAIAQASVASVRQGRAVVWRARMIGLSRDTAIQACEKITHSRSTCVVLSPDAQS